MTDADALIYLISKQDNPVNLNDIQKMLPKVPRNNLVDMLNYLVETKKIKEISAAGCVPFIMPRSFFV